MATEASEGDEGSEAAVQTVQVVEFSLGDERFAIDVDGVDSIVELEGSTRVPRTSEAITGVMDLRGEITAIIDPRAYLDVPAEGTAAESQVLVLDQSVDKQNIGLKVDQVVGVEEYEWDRIDDPEAFDELDTTGVREETIHSIIRRPTDETDFEPVAWLDVAAIIERSTQSTGVASAE